MSRKFKTVRAALGMDLKLPFDINSYVVDGVSAHVSLSRCFEGGQFSLALEGLHQLNVLLHELEEHRDALVERLEEEHRGRTARLAEPEDAAPGHERLETYEAVVTAANCCRVETSDFTDPIEDMLLLSGTKEGGEFVFIYHGQNIQGAPKNRPDLHIGDRIEFERLGGKYIRIVAVIPPAERGPAIDWVELFVAQMEGESGDEWFQDRERERDAERRERFA